MPSGCMACWVIRSEGVYTGLHRVPTAPPQVCGGKQKLKKEEVTIFDEIDKNKKKL